jgi:hypothetical protein
LFPPGRLIPDPLRADNCSVANVAKVAKRACHRPPRM